MSTVSNRKFAFTLAELMVILSVIAIITVASIKISKSRSDYAVNFQSYAAYSNLVIAVNELISEGNLVWSDSESKPILSSTSPKSLPEVGNDTAHALGLCNRMSELINVVGAVDCSLTADDSTNFAAAAPNFTATNGVRYYNLGSDANGACGADAVLKGVECVNTTNTEYTCNFDNGTCGDEAVAACTGSSSPKDPLPDNDDSFWGAEETFYFNYTDGSECYGAIYQGNQVFYTAIPCNAPDFATMYKVRCGFPMPAFTPANNHFTIYVDINGKRGNSVLNQDVFKFWVFTDGTVMPADGSLMLDNPKYISASVKNADGNFVYKRIGYKRAACLSNKIDESKIYASYCSSSGYGYAPISGCVAGATNRCSFIINKPGY